MGSSLLATMACSKLNDLFLVRVSVCVSGSLRGSLYARSKALQSTTTVGGLERAFGHFLDSGQFSHDSRDYISFIKRGIPFSRL